MYLPPYMIRILCRPLEDLASLEQAHDNFLATLADDERAKLLTNKPINTPEKGTQLEKRISPNDKNASLSLTTSTFKPSFTSHRQPPASVAVK